MISSSTMSLTVCVMAKAPVPGRVKTRLCPPLSYEQAAELAAAFLVDTWQAASGLSDATALLSYTGAREKFPPDLADAESFEQHGANLGARIEHAACLGLSRADRVLIIGSDLPGLTPGHLQSARNELDYADAVLGPSLDGGFYLIGLHRCSAGLLDGVPWSSHETYEQCAKRLRDQGLTVAETRRFDDIDTIDDLTALRNGIVAGSLLAPASAAVLSRLTCI